MKVSEGANPQPPVRSFGAAGSSEDCRLELDSAADDAAKLATWARRWRMAIRKTLRGGRGGDGGDNLNHFPEHRS